MPSLPPSSSPSGSNAPRPPSTSPFARATRRLLAYFFRGVVFMAPVAITVYICVVLFRTIDGWLGLPIPGAGFVVTIGVLTLIGFLGSGFITRGLLAALDDVLERLPFVRFLYASTRDFVNAFVGEKRRFDKPVVVRLFDNSSAHAVGFVTQDSLEAMGMAEWISVYMPHSYNFSGQMYLFRKEAVTPLDAGSSDVMAFIVSGGVTEIPVVANLPVQHNPSDT